jgi:hypothetical protein
MRWRCETAYVGENNILPNQPYCCVDGRIQLNKGKGKGEKP